MGDHLSGELLEKLSFLVGERLGLAFPEKRWADLERGLVSAAADLGMANPMEIARLLVDSSCSRRQLEVVAANLTVGETYFFRETRTFEVLEKEILPALITAREKSDRRIRVWSAGCCTGEEPYSIAILLKLLIPDLRSWNVNIMGTDINVRALARAAEGIYSEWSFRSTPPWIRTRFFTRKTGSKWQLTEEIRALVSFSYLNLAEDVYPTIENHTNAMDLLLCRNVLMYLNSARIPEIADRFHRSIVEDGWLLVGASEGSPALSPLFNPVYFPGTILYRKGQKPSRVIEALPDLEELVPEVERVLPALAPEAEPTVFSAVALNEPETAIELPTADLTVAAELLREGRLDEAERIARVAADISPGRAAAAALVARILADKGLLSEALVFSDRAVESDVLNPAYRYLRAMVQDELGKLADAVKSFEQALYLDDRFVLAHFGLANLQRRRHRIAPSALHFRVALSLLDTYDPEQQLPESEGLTASRLGEIIRATVARSERSAESSGDSGSPGRDAVRGWY